MNARARATLGAALAAVFAAACQTALDAGTLLAPDDPALAGPLERLRERSLSPSALRGRAHLSLRAPGVRLSRPQRIVAARPASLRVEVLALFDQVAGVVATDGVEYAFVDLASGARERGAVDDGLLWRAAGIDLAPSEAVALLLGAPPLDAAVHVVSARRYADGSLAVSLAESGAGSGGEQRTDVTFDAAGELRRAERIDEQGVRWRARFDDLRPIAGRVFAHAIELEFPRIDASARIEFRDVELDPELSRDVFVLQVAPGG